MQSYFTDKISRMDHFHMCCKYLFIKKRKKGQKLPDREDLRRNSCRRVRKIVILIFVFVQLLVTLIVFNFFSYIDKYCTSLEIKIRQL